MKEISIALIATATALYVASFSQYLDYLLRDRPPLAPRTFRLMLAGLVAHTVSILAFAWTYRVLPWETTCGNISFWTWSVVLAAVIATRRDRTTTIGAFAFPPVIILILAAFFVSKRPLASNPGVDAFLLWYIFHTGLIFLAYAAFLLATVTAVMYLTQHRLIKTRGRGRLSDRLPSLEGLERSNVGAIVFGLTALTVGLVAGLVWMRRAPTALSGTDPKILMAIFIWAAYGAVALGRAVALLRGRRMAWLSIGAFALVIISFFLVAHRLPGSLRGPQQPRIVRITGGA